MFISLDLSSSGTGVGRSEVELAEVREASGGMPWGDFNARSKKNKILINAIPLIIMGVAKIP